MNLHEWDAVVIGGGAAGLSAAQMLGRARRRTLVVDAGSPRNRFASHLHGTLGHDGRPPSELLARGREELTRYGVAVRSGVVVELAETARGHGADGRGHRDGTLRATLDDGTVLETRAVVLASGLEDVLPPVDGLRERWGRSILHCPYCHGWEVAQQRLGVLVSSPGAHHQLELVRQWSDDVTAFATDADTAAAFRDPRLGERLVARGIHTVGEPVVSVTDAPDGKALAVTTEGGAVHTVDALFAAPRPRIDLAFADALALERGEADGAPLAVDGTGATSHPRVWAAGNVVAAFANIPTAAAAGAMAGAAVNAALVALDVDAAVARTRRSERNTGWETRYATREVTWSGRVNAALADVAAPLPRGTALDVGCGEGADAIWLAEQGWRTVGMDVSPTAVARATAAARERGLDADRVGFVVADAVDALPDATYDLVAASFLHSWEADFPRIDILRAAAERVAPGGHLLVVSHAAMPWWATDDHRAPALVGPDAEFDLLGLDPAEWTALVVDGRSRPATAPDGTAGELIDGVILVQRRGDT